MKILINTPDLSLSGGVASHYLGLKDYWNENVKYNYVGRRNKRGELSAPLLVPYDILKFFLKLLLWHPDIVLLNPSMAPRAIKRDLLYLRIAKGLGFKIAVFFHGFHTVDVEYMKDDIVRQLNRCSIIFVLASEFKKILVDWGVTSPIQLATTKVDNKLIENFDLTTRNGEVNNVLFLARVTKPKGIFVALDVFKRIANINNKIKFTVVGGGEDLEKAKVYAKELGLTNITFTGALSGKDLVEQFKKGDLYIFTSYHEGMPTSVLEAMAFGLPVITRPLGGLVDFFENGKMGYIVDSDNADDYLGVIKTVLENPSKMKEISKYNHQYAKDNFMATAVSKNMEKALKKIL